MHGQFVWYELTTPDVDAARKFYPPITGWGTQPFDKDYMMWTTRGVPIAGIFRLGPEQRQKGIPPNWMPYVDVNSVDETARKATSLGGKVMHGPEDIPGTGRFAVLQDPQGAVFGVYGSSKMSRPWDGTPVVGRFSWHELMTTDYQKAFDFYRQLFGWEKTGEMDMGGGNMYFMYGKGKPFGGIFNRPPEMASMPPFWMVYVHVKDVPKAVDTATKAGGFVKQPPMEVPGGVIAILGDPQGAGFAVHAATAPASKPAATKASKAASRPKAKAAKSRPKAKAAAKKSSGKGKAKPKRKSR
jgi:predicted enzyme related to lactoylglutathione lyase